MSRCQRECHRFEPDILLQILLIYTMYDIIFCTLPVMSIDQIYSAPALLKGIVKSAGFRSRTFDFVIDLNKFCNKNSEQFSRIQNYFVTQNLFLNQDDQDILNKWYNHVATTLQSIDTKYIGFSVFSNWTHRATLEILLKLKELDLSHKVVLGGRGLKTNTNDTVVDLLPNKSINDRIHWFGTVLKNKGLAQHIIIGDGENAVVDFLQTNTTRNDNVAKGFDFPWPDYSDYNFDDYNWNGSPHLQVIGSKGCVRNCDFCDVKVQFGNYQFKDGYQLPIRHSQVARSKSAVSGAMRPKVSMLMVRVARSCAGLRPAKNLRAPNHKKTIPRLMRNKRMPCAAIQRVKCASIASARDHRLDMRRV